MSDVLTLTLRGVRVATPTTRILEADLGDAPFHFRAGQAVVIGLHGHPVRQPYSIACAPADVRRTRRLEFLLAVNGSGREGTPLAGLRPGAKLDVEGPSGSFVLPDALNARPLLFIGGGTGIAPLRSMIREALARQHSAPVTLIYSARRTTEFSYLDEFRRLVRQGRLQLLLTASRLAGPRWRGERGRITRTLLEQGVPYRDLGGRDVEAFLCGPPTFVSDLAQIVSQLGVRAARIHTERWHD
ncbi:MAG: ferredoxin--NADP reductase [Vicinamibacteraceae bacterium]